MESSLVFEQYPSWYIGLCVLLGIVYATILYFKDTTFKEATKNEKRALWPLSFFRAFVVSAIAFLLLSPLLKTRFIDIVKPYIIIAQDNSESIKSGFETVDSTAYKQQLTQLINGLEGDYRVKLYSFGDGLQEERVDSVFNFAYDKKVTNISESLDEIYDKYNNQNVGAIVVASDGIFNQGSNPLYSNTKLDVPMYAVALGDTTAKRDLIVDKVLHNRIAYLDDKFTIRVDLSAQNSKGQTTVLNVYKGKATNNRGFSKTIQIKEDDFIFTQEVVLDAKEAGIQQYSVRAKAINDEVTTQNNRQDIFIDVLDNRQKVLILAASPHPDVAAIRKAIETNKNYELTVDYISKFTQSVKDFNVAILHGLPAKNNSAETVINQLKGSNIPMFFVVSGQTDVAQLNKVQSLVQIITTGTSSNEVKAEVVGNFNLFTFENDMSQNLPSLPPINTPFGKYQTSPTAQTLLKQKIGSVPTDYPLLVMQQATGDKAAVFCGEGLWRWRFYDYKEDESADVVDELLMKTVQYLSVKNDKRKFRVHIPKNLFNENERITFDAELYNDSYQLVNNPDVSLTIYNDAGKAFPFVFNKTASAYTLDAGFFPVGNYSYKATTAFNGKEYTANGNFSIAPILLESLQTTANHQLLYNLTTKNNGKVVYPDSVKTLERHIRTSENIKPISYSSYQTKELINLQWLFFLFLGLLSVEWFVRKLIGGY